MKKWLLLVASVATNVGAFAQWALPVPSSTVEMPKDATNAAYLYNLGAGGFLAGANAWGTRASVSKTGDKVYLETPDDEFYSLRCYPSTKNAWKYISANNDKDCWVDGDTGNGYQGVQSWSFQEHDGYYTFTNSNAKEQYGGGNFAMVEIVNGQKGRTELWFYDSNITNQEGEPMFDGKVYDKWVFISEEVYGELAPAVELYQTSQNLYAAILNAKANDEAHDYSRFEDVYKAKATVEDMEAAIANINAFVALNNEINEKTPEYEGRCDFSSVLAVYNNPDATTEELEEAKKKITEIITDYEQTIATFDNPAQMAIGDGSSFDPWTREFTGDGTTGDPATNTWSTEANDGGDGTDMLTPFCQVWTGAGGLLSDQKVFQNLYATPGLYELIVDLRAYNEAGAIDRFKGLSMFFGKDTIDLQAQVDMYVKNGKAVLWKEDYFKIVSVVKEAGQVQFGFNVKDANFNWFAFKNTSLKFYGNKDANKNAIALMQESIPPFDPFEGEALQSLKDDYNNKIKAFEEATDFDEYMKLLGEIADAKAALDANVKAYETLAAKIDNWGTTRQEKQGLTGDEWNAFWDFIDGEDGIEGYPEINIAEIFNNGERPMTTDEVYKLIDELSEKFTNALAGAIVPGTDCSDMLANASFGNGFNGWSGKNINDGSKVYTAGEYGMNNVEVYQNSVDCSQTINKVPNGIYSLTCRVYERRGDNDPANVFLFLNQFKTPVQHIKTGAINQENAENKINCFDTKDDGSTDYPADSRYTDGEGVTWLYPNSQEGASYAFAAGRYEQKVYGIIDNGKLNIGLTSNGKKVDWVLWADFKLVFEGKTEKAVTEILASYLDQLDGLVNDNLPYLSQAESEKADDILKVANKAFKDKDVDAMFDNITIVAAEIEAINARVALIPLADEANTAIVTAKNNFEEKLGIFDENVPEDVKKAYEEWIESYEKIAYEKMSDEDIKEFAARGHKVSDMINAVVGRDRLATVLADVNFDEATDEEPIDVTPAIENNNFEYDGNPTVEGWTIVKGGDTDAKPISNGTYTVNFPEGYEAAGDYVFNTWSGSIPDGGLPISQDIYGLPAGTYTVKAILASDANNIVTLYANNFSEDYKMEGDKTHATLAGFKFYLSEEESFKLTIKVNSASWYKCDYFQLFYHGKANTSTAIDEVAAEPATNAEPAAIYNISGVRVSALTKGINIVKMADGKVKKVIVK